MVVKIYLRSRDKILFGKISLFINIRAQEPGNLHERIYVCKQFYNLRFLLKDHRCSNVRYSYFKKI